MVLIEIILKFIGMLLGFAFAVFVAVIAYRIVLYIWRALGGKYL